MKPSSQRPRRKEVPDRIRKVGFKFDTATLSLSGLGLLSLGLIGAIALTVFSRTRTQELTIAAGAAQGESYILSKALETVIERHHPRIQITVQETQGTSKNLQLLEQQQVQLATAQADVPPGPSARLIAFLYSDKFQLLVHSQSSIRSFPDLAGKRIALPPKGGQFQSFLDVADHFGLKEADFRFVGGTEQEANRAFIQKQADAAFRVRALGNPSILNLVQTVNPRFVSIEQAPAMRIKYPALEPGLIPRGAYRGQPAMPETDLATVAVQRTLVVHKDVDEEIIWTITRVLMERRQEIAAAIADEAADVRPLVASIHRPDVENTLGSPLHPGAQAYYDRNKPSFLQENADFVALILTVILLLSSWLWQLKQWVERKRKNQADLHSQAVIDLMRQLPETSSLKELEERRQALLVILEQAVNDLDEDRITDDSFQSFQVIWQIALDAVRERWSALARSQQRTIVG